MTQFWRDTTMHSLPGLSCPMTQSEKSTQKGEGSACQIILRIVVSEESSSWLETYVCFFRLDHRQIWRLYVAGPKGQSCCTHIRLGACVGSGYNSILEQVHCSLWSRKQSRSQARLAGHAFSHIYIPRPGAFIPRSLYLRLQAEVFFRCLRVSLYRV